MQSEVTSLSLCVHGIRVCRDPFKLWDNMGMLRRGWSIVVTGHSLGAGAAALVALYIRSFYPNSRAWVFEPPGADAANNG